MAVAVGAKVSGKVTGITNFGAFVDMGEGQTGLVHISEISNSFVKDIHDVLSVGDKVTVKVMSMKDGKIGLSIKHAEEHPADEQHHHEGGRPQHQSHGNFHQGEEAGQRRQPHHDFKAHRNEPKDEGGDDLDSMLSGFMKDSEQRLSTLRRNTEGKRGGRGGRRS